MQEEVSHALTRHDISKRYRQLRVHNLPKVHTWRLEWDSNLRPSDARHGSPTTEAPSPILIYCGLCLFICLSIYVCMHDQFNGKPQNHPRKTTPGKPPQESHPRKTTPGNHPRKPPHETTPQKPSQRPQRIDRRPVLRG